MQLTVKEAARFLEVPERQIHAWIDDGAIPFAREQGRIRFNQAELLEWATGRGLRAATVLAPSAAPGPALADALSRGGVHPGLRAASRDEAVRAAVEALPLPPDADRAMLVEVLLAREAAGSTAVGDGIAIPHVRAPIVQNGVEPAVALCALDAPVEFGARDGKPVHTLFLLAVPTVNAHLMILARLAAALHDAEFKAAVLRLLWQQRLATDLDGRLDADSELKVAA